MGKKTFNQENLYEKYHKIRNNFGIKMTGIPLDDETQDIITFNMQESLQSIICYDYEDGKPWHDLTCVMCIPRSKQDIGALKKGHSALKRGQLKNCQI